jgi:uncharacterized protein with PIN domain
MRIKAFLDRVHWKIAGVFYTVAWCSRIQDKDDLGYCDTEARILFMKDGELIEETFKTLIHELLHAMDDTYKIKLSHTQVRKLELAIAEFLIQNKIVH